MDLAGFFIQLGAQVFLRLVVLARGDDDRVFHRTDHNLRINPLFPAQGVNRVVKLTCHMNRIPKSNFTSYELRSHRLPGRSTLNPKFSTLNGVTTIPVPGSPSRRWPTQFPAS